MERICIAIDGPAASGKSTIAKIISKALGIIYLDTGAMYRAVAYKALQNEIDPKDRNKLSGMIESSDIKIVYRGDEQLIFLDGENITNNIRNPEVSIAASDVSAIPEVRIKLVDIQREIARVNDVVMDGRDIGTYVLPHAKLKFFLTASVEERAKRRYNEQVGNGLNNISFDEVRKDLEYRDKNDSNRDMAPLKKAEDAVEIDTTGMTVKQVADKILSYMQMSDIEDE